MNAVLDEIFRSGCVTGPLGERFVVQARISQQEGEFLQEIIAAVRPKVSLEIGLAHGVSALFICEALSAVGAERHIVIDPHQFAVPDGFLTADPEQTKVGFGGIGLRNLRVAGFESLVEFHERPSHLALPRLLESGRSIDFAFIDGWHTFDYVMVDFFYIDKMLRPGGIITFDDANYASIRKVCRYVVTNLPYDVFVSRKTAPSSGSSWRRRLLLETPLVSSYVRRIARPEILESDAALGLERGKCLALRKRREDVLGDGAGGSRRWSFHREF